MTALKSSAQLSAPGEVLCEYSEDGAVLDIVLNRPSKRNALSPPMAREITAALKRAVRENVHMVVFRSTVNGAFCAGFDIGYMRDASADPAEPLYELYTCLEHLPAVTVAFADGLVVGGGVELFLCCDLRLSSPLSTFRMPPAKLSVVYEREGIARFIRRTGLAATTELFLTGRSLTAQEAERCGLVTRVMTEDAFLDYRADISTGAPLAQRAMKEIIVAHTATPGMSDERFGQLKRTVSNSLDRDEALNAFKEKRPPRFTGR
ncbi:enoyl-CoA hydratase/isomerase family protein [Roseixanthobacter liquoris]|uniref:enoyl-CoA hydratase/isomerase family protein n=1 Tax=Roseixanthobacter liquoris TaxID=3119921 RepID=UPI00372A689F